MLPTRRGWPPHARPAVHDARSPFRARDILARTLKITSRLFPVALVIILNLLAFDRLADGRTLPSGPAVETFGSDIARQPG